MVTCRNSCRCFNPDVWQPVKIKIVKWSKDLMSLIIQVIEKNETLKLIVR